jgi:uncharacterized protein (TIGR03083 family)
MKPAEPISTVELFPQLSHELIAVLRSLDLTDWARPTACSSWTVKDVAAHLLGGNLGRLWNSRKSSHSPQGPDQEHGALVSLINRNNQSWVQAARRISPEILTEFLELTDGHLYDLFRDLEPNEPARVAVSWAGDNQSPNWFDIAREYTEKWHHQQHIREAVGQPLLLGRKWLFPVLDTFVRALPHTFSNVDAEDGTTVSLRIMGEAGGVWTLAREDRDWHLLVGLDADTASCVNISQDLAWRLFTKGVNREDARRQVHIDGDLALGSHILNMVAIMA